MKPTLLSVAHASLVAMASASSMETHHGHIASDYGPGTPGHGRPSVTRKKKVKTHGKNKKRK